ncbi:hypothetical protein CALK_0682 [Chitinivibrio alkaliphilus ACht1]|uniref:Glycosyl-4,4'-diaponeurosporenoate acyltransferase n=1 Tax=Chitinivibrio alkaliphilus ACht1 TaxID=1313304 RepID=U7DCP2_9BACT|nr:hypothetical protein [Chitinivibrio alkaliphilus]ERP38666.1 hypothetical protein CALK_0682 [Chitinivibrio alkaliphilus ACht1]
MSIPLFVPPWPWLVAGNIAGWLCLHLIIAFGGTLLPAARISIDWRLFAPLRGEANLYRLLRVKRWKDRIPDGAVWFPGGIAKKGVVWNRETVPVLLRETCRGELVHWIVLSCVPLFFYLIHLWYGRFM